MPAVEVHSERLARRWVAPCLSPACAAHAAIVAATALLPLWAAAATHSACVHV